MSASSFSIVDGTDGIAEVPFSTPEANGHAAAGHLAMIPVVGLATPVDETRPLPIAATYATMK